MSSLPPSPIVTSASSDLKSKRLLSKLSPLVSSSVERVTKLMRLKASPPLIQLQFAEYSDEDEWSPEAKVTTSVVKSVSSSIKNPDTEIEATKEEFGRSEQELSPLSKMLQAMTVEELSGRTVPRRDVAARNLSPLSPLSQMLQGMSIEELTGRKVVKECSSERKSEGPANANSTTTAQHQYGTIMCVKTSGCKETVTLAPAKTVNIINRNVIVIDVDVECEKNEEKYEGVMMIKNVNTSAKESLPVVSAKDDDLFSRLLQAAALDDPLPNGWSLFDHQKEAIKQCLELRRTILAFDMGLGKTVIALIWAKAFALVLPSAACVTVVICPVTLMESWRREAESVGFSCRSPDHNDHRNGKNAFGDGGHLGSDPAISKPRLVIVSWARIGSYSELCVQAGLKHKNPATDLLVIADEAHAMQSMQSMRTRAALALCHHPRCRGVVLATGTPMKNGRPSNVYPLLLAIRHPVARDKIAFEKRYCNARKTAFCPWDISGCSHLEELRAVVGRSLLRKTKEECLCIPSMRRRFVSVDVSPEHAQEYADIQDRLAQINKRGKRRIAGPASQGGQCALELISTLRMLSSLAKVPGTVEIVRNILKNDSRPVVVFVCFKETARLLVEALGAVSGAREYHGVGQDRLRCKCITGDLVKPGERQAVVDAFQSGGVDVLVCTFGVGATGLTLTKSRCVVLLDRPWTPGDVKQAEDRIRRIGQTASDVESVWVTAHGFTGDDEVDVLLQKKDSSTQKVLADAQHRKLLSTLNTNVVAPPDKKAGDITLFFGEKKTECSARHADKPVECH